MKVEVLDKAGNPVDLDAIYDQYHLESGQLSPEILDRLPDYDDFKNALQLDERGRATSLLNGRQRWFYPGMLADGVLDLLLGRRDRRAFKRMFQDPQLWGVSVEFELPPILTGLKPPGDADLPALLSKRFSLGSVVWRALKLSAKTNIPADRLVSAAVRYVSRGSPEGILGHEDPVDAILADLHQTDLEGDLDAYVNNVKRGHPTFRSLLTVGVAQYLHGSDAPLEVTERTLLMFVGVFRKSFAPKPSDGDATLG